MLLFHYQYKLFNQLFNVFETDGGGEFTIFLTYNNSENQQFRIPAVPDRNTFVGLNPVDLFNSGWPPFVFSPGFFGYFPLSAAQISWDSTQLGTNFTWILEDFIVSIQLNDDSKLCNSNVTFIFIVNTTTPLNSTQIEAIRQSIALYEDISEFRVIIEVQLISKKRSTDIVSQLTVTITGGDNTTTTQETAANAVLDLINSIQNDPSDLGNVISSQPGGPSPIDILGAKSVPTGQEVSGVYVPPTSPSTPPSPSPPPPVVPQSTTQIPTRSLNIGEKLNIHLFNFFFIIFIINLF